MMEAKRFPKPLLVTFDGKFKQLYWIDDIFEFKSLGFALPFSRSAEQIRLLSLNLNVSLCGSNYLHNLGLPICMFLFLFGLNLSSFIMMGSLARPSMNKESILASPSSPKSAHWSFTS